MAYFLGIDLGTTYTAAARWQDGRASVVRLGGRSAEIPSVVLLKEDGDVITGEAAERRAIIEPQRVAREFKRRIGDPTPFFLGGTPRTAQALMIDLLGWVVERATADEGGPPAGIAVTHPANWGGYKKDLLLEALEAASLPGVALVTEPEAAAIHYASQERIEPGSVIAVYDLGGGTFDAAVLRRTGAGWEILGLPEGVERLGGVDFDEAVVRHVAASVGEAYDLLDPDDPPVMAAVARLRQECVAAKEALTGDTEATIPVLLPGVQGDVRLTRREFEAMIRPALGQSITALERALRTAGVEPDGVDRILLVGGSSRIPVVGQLVVSALGRPVALDAHPKHGVALGAAIVAAREGRVGGEGAAHGWADTPAARADRMAPAGAGARAAASTDAAWSPGLQASVGVLSPASSRSGLAGTRPAVSAAVLERTDSPARRPGVPSTFQVPGLAPARHGDGHRGDGHHTDRPHPDRAGADHADYADHVGPTDAASDDREPQRPPFALLIGGAAGLVAVVLGGLLALGERDQGTADTDQPGSPPTVPLDPGPAAISRQTDVGAGQPAATVPGLPPTLPPGVATTLPAGVTTTLGPAATSTLPPAPTTTAPPATTTTLPPPTTTEPPPPTTTTPPAESRGVRESPEEP
jgi:actin-like ATPase involved in cell morphogenesis